MIRQTLAAAVLLLAIPATQASAQTQAELDARYDRALAAGYKALMLCGAIANAELFGAERSVESVEQWELAGIQQPQAQYIGELPFQVVRTAEATVDYVAVNWAEDMPPRYAAYSEGLGCSVLPVGFVLPASTVAEGALLQPAIAAGGQRVLQGPLAPVIEGGFTSTYGEAARTTAIIVSGQQGESSRYAAGFGPATPQRTWSVAKSIAATIIGAAVQRGEVDVYTSAGLGTNEGDPRADITIDNALRMASGRFSDTPGNRTDPLYFGGATVDEVALDWPVVSPPGSIFRYANNDTLAAVQAIAHTFANHPPAELFAQLGMRHTVAETDWLGNYVLSSQVWTTAPDLMRLGQLYLNDGVLPDGTRVLPEGWTQYVSNPSGPQPDRAGWGYGAGWWLMNDVEGVPPDTFFANGNRGQYVVVVPSRNVVIVRRGEDPAGGSGFDISAFTRDVLAALEE